MSRALVAIVAALGLAVAGLGYALVFFIGRSTAADTQLNGLQGAYARQQKLIGALQHQVAGLGGTPLTVPPTTSTVTTTPPPLVPGAGAGSADESPPRARATTARPQPRRSIPPPRSPSPTSRPRSPSPSPSPSVCVLTQRVCLPPIVASNVRASKSPSGASVQRIGQAGLIVVVFGATGVAWRRRK